MRAFLASKVMVGTDARRGDISAGRAVFAAPANEMSVTCCAAQERRAVLQPSVFQ